MTQEEIAEFGYDVDLAIKRMQEKFDKFLDGLNQYEKFEFIVLTEDNFELNLILWKAFNSSQELKAQEEFILSG